MEVCVKCLEEKNNCDWIDNEFICDDCIENSMPSFDAFLKSIVEDITKGLRR